MVSMKVSPGWFITNTKRLLKQYNLGTTVIEAQVSDRVIHFEVSSTWTGHEQEDALQ